MPSVAQRIGETDRTRLQLAISEGALRIDEGDLVAAPRRDVRVDEIGNGVVGPAFGDAVHPGPPPSAFEQPREQAPRQHAGNAPAVMAGRERRLHRHDLVAHQRVEALDHALVEPTAAQLGGAGQQHRARIGAGEGDAQIRELAFVFPERDGNAGDRILDRAADTDLVIGRAQTACSSRARR